MASEFDYEQQQEIRENGDRTYAQPVGAVYPTFFVGVGGCGSEIVQKIYDMLRARPDFKDRYEKLIQFIAIDTDMDDLKDLSLPQNHKFLISDFPKGEYVNIKTGREYKDPDPFFCQWWPDWYATRPDSTKGAGQIRVESRLSLYYQLENDRGGLIETFNDAIVRAKDHDNPFRVVRPPLAYCHIFGSVAGGTGSGGYLTLAYLFRELLESHRLSPVMVGHLLLPSLFYRKVRHRLHKDIQANGYAALKELEWFMTLGYNNNPRMMRGDVSSAVEDCVEFNYNPNNRPENGNRCVAMPPFHLVNVIDEPGDFSFADPKDIYPAVAGCAYVQLFSPIIGQRESEEDNYYKKIKHLEGGFSLNYGTYGLSMLVLPDRDILDYSENRMMKGLLLELCGSEEESSDAKFFERFKFLAREQVLSCKDEPGDVRGLATMRYLVEAGIVEVVFPDGEEREIVAKGWKEAVDGTRRGLFHEFQEFVLDKEKEVDKQVDRLPDTLEMTEDTLPSKATGKREELERHLDDLSDSLRATIQQYDESVSKRCTLDPEALRERVTKFLGSTFDGRKPGPLSVRLALIAVRNELSDKRSEIDVGGAGSAVPASTGIDSSKEELLFRWGFEGLDKLRAAPFINKFVPGEDDWKECRNSRVPELWSEDIQSAQRIMKGLTKANIFSIANRWINEELETLKDLDVVLRSIVEGLDEKLGNALRAEGGMSDEFILDDEVFTGVRTRKRHWERLFSWLVKVKAPQVSDPMTDVGFERWETDSGDEIRAKLSTALELQEELSSRAKAISEHVNQDLKSGQKRRSPSEAKLKSELEQVARRFCRRRLVGLIMGKRQAGDDRDSKGLMIDECLELEARWELEELFVRDHLIHYEKDSHRGLSLMSPDEKAKLRRELITTFEPSEQDIRAYIEEKIKFVADKARSFSRLRLTETTSVDPFTFVCMHKKHYEQEKSLFRRDDGQGETLASFVTQNQVLRNARTLDGWTDEKRIAFFNAQAGLPIHNFWPVEGELRDAYEMIYREYVTGHNAHENPVCDFPSHVDKNFEEPAEWDPHTVLPDLAPGRKIGRRQSGVRDFMELVAHDLVREYDLPASQTEDEEIVIDETRLLLPPGLRDLLVKAGLIPAVPGKALPILLKLAQSWQHAKESNHVRKLPARTVWVLVGESPKVPRGADPVEYERKKPFLEILGDRLDRACERYQKVFCRHRANRGRMEHLAELTGQYRNELLEEENPNAFQMLLQTQLEKLRAERDEIQTLLDQGFRYRGYLDFLNSAIDSLKELYKNYKERGTLD